MTTRHQHNISGELPAEFPVRMAYMQLYSAHTHHDSMWPREAFVEGAIDALLSRHHAAPVTHKGRIQGYTLTERGRAVWERYVRLQTKALSTKNTRKPRAQSRPGHVRASRSTRTLDLLAGLVDGHFHDPREILPWLSSTWLTEIRIRLSKASYVEREMINQRWHVRITDAGRAALKAYEENEQ